MPLSVPRPISLEQAALSRDAGWWPDVTLPGLLRRWAERAPQAPALIAADRTLAFEDLDRESDRVAAGLARLGVGRGDVVSCQLANVPELVVLLLAVAKRRAIFGPIHLPYRAAEVEGILAFAESKVMVVGPPYGGFDFAGMVDGLRPRLPALRHLVTLGATPRDAAVPFDELARTPPLTRAEPPDPDDPFLLLFTSGTTASPRATLHTHNMRLGNARPIAPEIGLTPEDRVLSLSRLSHMWGLMMYGVALWAGAPHVLLSAFTPDAFAETVARHRATVAIGAPAHVADILSAPGFTPAPLASLRLFALSGSVCPPSLAQGLRERAGCTPLMLWGMTETGNGCFTRPGDPPEIVEQTVGHASPGCRLAIAGEEGHRLPPGQEGELVIASPFVFEGYVNNPAATEESFTADGWFRTGDLATIDTAGNVRIRGRRKEQINRGGVKFHPADVEEILLRHPSVELAALVGMPDDRLGERNCCFVVPRPGATPPALDELIALCDASGVAKLKWPERLEVVEALPLTPTGKVQRALLRERMGQ